jgi:hypothetical protein
MGMVDGQTEAVDDEAAARTDWNRLPSQGEWRFCAALGYGETLSREIAGVTRRTSLPIMGIRAGRIDRRLTVFDGERAMDLAMAMGVALFGMFTVSTVYFFYKVAH